MKKSEYKKLANEVIKDIFNPVIKSDDAKIWKKCLLSIYDIIKKYEQWERWTNMFVYREVRNIMSNKFWKKFIINK